MAVQIVRPNVEEENKNKLGALDMIAQAVNLGSSIASAIPGQQGPVQEGIDTLKDAGTSGKPVNIAAGPMGRRFAKMGGRFQV